MDSAGGPQWRGRKYRILHLAKEKLSPKTTGAHGSFKFKFVGVFLLFLNSTELTLILPNSLVLKAKALWAVIFFTVWEHFLCEPTSSTLKKKEENIQMFLFGALQLHNLAMAFQFSIASCYWMSLKSLMVTM